MAKEVYENCQVCFEYKKVYKFEPKMICRTCYTREYQRERTERTDNSIFISALERRNKIKAILKAIDSGMSDAEVAFHFKCSRQYSHRVRKNNLRDLAGYGDCGGWNRGMKKSELE